MSVDRSGRPTSVNFLLLLLFPARCSFAFRRYSLAVFNSTWHVFTSSNVLSPPTHWREARASEMSIRGVLLLLLLKGSVHCQGTCREFTHSVFTRAPQPSLSILCLCPRTPMPLPSTAPFQAGMFIGLIMSRFVVCSARGRGRSTLMVV